MARSIKLWALVVLLLATGLSAQDARITIESSITSAEVVGPIVKGSMHLTIVNATETRLGNVTLRLATPASGSIGDEGTVSVGTIEIDTTSSLRVSFQIESAFLDGEDPPVISLTYDDASGERREASIAVRRRVEGGGL